MSLNVSYPGPPPVDELKRDWAGIPWNWRAEARWVAPRAWGIKEFAYARGPGLEMLVEKTAHERLGDILRLVRSIDSVAYGWLRQEAMCDGKDGEWRLDLPRKYMNRVLMDLQTTGQNEGSPLWTAATRAAQRAASRVKERVGSLRKGDAYGWTRPYGPFDVVATIRLPFGAWRDRPLRMLGAGRYADDDLLGEFEIRDALKWKAPKSGAPDVRPEACAYAECALLSGGWAVRFIAARADGRDAPPAFV